MGNFSYVSDGFATWNHSTQKDKKSPKIKYITEDIVFPRSLVKYVVKTFFISSFLFVGGECLAGFYIRRHTES